MATSKIILTSTVAVEVLNSSAGCNISPSDNILYGFGDTAPTDFATFTKSDLNANMDYSGDYGSMWIRKAYNTQDDIDVIVFSF